MSYATQANLESVFGVDNVARWSQLDPDEAGADTDRIAAAIAYASAWIDARLSGGRYIVPLPDGTSAPLIIVDAAARIAGWWLYGSRGFHDADAKGDRVQEHREHAESVLDRIVSGQVQIVGAPLLQQAGYSPAVVE